MQCTRLEDDSQWSFSLPGVATSIAVVSEDTVIVGINEGTVVICSNESVISHFRANQRPIAQVKLLALDPESGLVTYVAAEEGGQVELRMLERSVAGIGDGIERFGAGENGIVVGKDGRLLKMDRAALLGICATVKLEELELPRRAICEYFRRSIEIRV
jgi:hypothetical protein